MCLSVFSGQFGAICVLKRFVLNLLAKNSIYSGSVLYCIGLSTILLALTIGDPLSARQYCHSSRRTGIFRMVIFVELRQKHPTLDLTLFKIRAFAAGTISAFLNFLAFGCGPFLRSLYLQLILGYSALKAGILAYTNGSRNLYLKPN